MLASAVIDAKARNPLLPALILGAGGLLVLGLQPLLYSLYVQEGLIGEERLGTLAAVEIAAIAFGSMVGVALFKHMTTRAVALIGIALLAAGNLLPYGGALFIVRAVAGLGGGLIVALAAARIAQHHNVNAASGLFLFLQATSQYAIMQAFSFIAPTANATIVQMTLAALIAVLSPLLLLVPRWITVADEAHSSGPLPFAGWTALAICGLFLGSAIGVWAYLGVWLESAGLSDDVVANRLTASLAGQIVGALCAIAIGTHRHSGLQVFLSGIVMVAVVALLLCTGPAGLSGLALLVGFGIAWMIGTPALSGLVLECDAGRRSLSYAAPAQLLGAALIPSFVGELLAPKGLEQVLAACAAIVALSLILIPVALARRLPARDQLFSADTVTENMK